MSVIRTRRSCIALASALVCAGAMTFSAATTPAAAADPIRIGLSLSLTGPTAAAGKQVLAGLEIWRDEIGRAHV